MPEPKNYNNENEFMAACIPVALKEGLSQEEAKGKCFGMWNNKEMQEDLQPAQPGQMQPPPKPKGKIDFLTEIKKLFEKYGVAESDEKIIEIINSLNVQGMTMEKRLSLIEMQMVSDTEEQEILVFPRGKHFVKTKNYEGWLDFNDKFFKNIAMNFDDPALFKPFVDKDHERKESYGDIIGYRIAEDGMFFKLALNKDGLDQIKNRNYRYISPTFGDTKDTQNKAHEDWLVTISLVNTPSLMGLIPALQEQLELKFNFEKKTKGKKSMELNFMGKELKRFIDLQAEVSPEAIMQALPEIVKKLQELTDMVTKLTGENAAQSEEIAKKEEAMNQMSAELTKIETEKRSKEAESIIKQAVELGQYCASEKFLELKKEEYIKNPDKIIKELSFIPKTENKGQQSLNNVNDKNIELSKEDKEIMLSSGWDIDDPAQIKRWIKDVKMKMEGK